MRFPCCSNSKSSSTATRLFAVGFTGCSGLITPSEVTFLEQKEAVVSFGITDGLGFRVLL